MAPLLDPDHEGAQPDHVGARMSTALREFLETEIAGGVFLVVAAAIALAWAGWAFPSYRSVWTGRLPGNLASIGLPEDLRALINDGLMTLFFFVVGLEIKRELVSGELRDRRAAALPVIAALGGMAAPAVIFLLMTRGPAGHGWGIPMATDIAFALGILTLFGRGLPQGLRVLLLTLAVADDIGTLIVITLFYASSLYWLFLIAAVLLLVALRILSHRRVGRRSLYVVAGCALWWLTLRSGIPPTVAGVALGLAIPSGGAVVEEIEHLLHPWTSFLILPLFALANAGVPIALGRIGSSAGSEVALAVLVARITGKFVGIAVGAWIAVRLGVGVLPDEVGWRHILALGCVASVGFTIPLFVATLAFESSGLVEDAKFGILLATGFGFIIGGLSLRLAARGVRSTA
ncbi:MAG: Na+:H+ antiporter, NhaA family [Actinomycetota bacterium]|jgi:NhaA family Na+:H+ antiporter|nr:Na+:H+ antiporter, NhaA family [Actinomycetota bacterium]